MLIHGDLAPKRGKYLEAIRSNWQEGLITYINEVYCYLTNNENGDVKIDVYEGDAVWIQIDENMIYIQIEIEKFKINYNFFNHPKVKIESWLSSIPCQGLTIENLVSERFSYIDFNIKNNRIKNFEIDLDNSDSYYDILYQIRNFDLSQVENITLVSYGIQDYRNLLKYLIYQNKKIELVPNTKDDYTNCTKFISLLCCNPIKETLEDPSLFQTISELLI